MPFCVFAAEDNAEQGNIDGTLAGNEVNSSYVGPFMCGFFANVVGVGISYGLASSKTPTIDPITLSRLDRHNTEYQDAFITAYKKAAKAKITRTALVGSLSGAVLQTLVVVLGEKLMDTGTTVKYQIYSISW